jgi:predicted NBD/HSP70 family sugar kinase
VYCAPAAIVRPGGQPRNVLAAYHELCAAAAAGDAAAGRRVDTAAGYLGTAVVSLVNLLDVDLVVLGGPGLASAGETYRAAVAAAVRDGALARACHEPQVIISALGPDAAAIGAASLVFYGAFVPGLTPAGSVTDS